MWLLSTLLGLLLCCPSYSTHCGNDVPANCEFNKTDGFCGWEHQNWTLHPSRDGYAFLASDALSGYMKSKERCVSSNISHCLRFRFRLKRNETDSVSVSMSWPSNNTELLLWKYSTQTNFTNATVPVLSESNFVLVISAQSLNARNCKDIGVDRLKYVTDRCALEPPSAEPLTTAPTTTTRATTTTTTTTTTITTAMMTSSTTPSTTKTSSTITETTTAITKKTRGATTTAPAIKITDNSSLSGVTHADTSSSKTGIIVGIVLAVIGAVVIGVVVCIVIRRRQVPLMAMLSARKKNHTEDSGYHNPAVDSVGENCNEVNTTNSQDSSTPRICSSMSNDDYSVIDDIQTKDVTSSPFQPITSLYSKAKVLHSEHREDSKTQTSSPDANPYDLIDEELGVCQARGSSLTVEYNILASHKTAENLPEPTQTGGVYHVLGPGTQVTESGPTGVYHILEETETQNPTEKKMSSHPDTCLSEGAKGDYHSLDFQKKLRTGDGVGDSGDEMGQTYSHLNEACQDTYSELSREKKRKVVDGDYSHVTMD